MRRPLTFAGVLVLLALVFSVAAAVAATPSLKPGKGYSTAAGHHAVSLTLVTSVKTPNRIEEGGAALASQYAHSGGSISCPKAKKTAGYHGAPFVIFGFPGTTLHPQGGNYAFSVKVREPAKTAVGSGVKPFTLKVQITGMVKSPTEITGTISATGGPCGTKKPIPYTAALNPELPVAPQ